MTQQEREANPEESFDGGYLIYADEIHRQRVTKNSERIVYAKRQLEQHGIEYTLKNEATGHFHCRCKTDDKLIQFWAGTGKIMGYKNLRSIHNLIRLCEGENLKDMICIK